MSLRSFGIGPLGFLLMVAGACSGSDDKPSSSCSTTDECPAWQCVCVGGLTATSSACILDKCADGAEACEMVCQEGVQQVSAAPTLAGTSECSQVCNAASAAGCEHGGCVHRYCDIPASSCEAAVRENLACLAANVSWTCDNTFVEPVPPGACVRDDQGCEQDVGTD